MLYFDALPDHRDKYFNEQSHFGKFGKYNMVFNAVTSRSHCERHVGCLSIKTVWSGMEAYRFQGIDRKVTPGQFLILNNEQTYSSSIDSNEKVRSLSVFFTTEFAASVFHDVKSTESDLLDHSDEQPVAVPEFFQTLYTLDPTLEVLLKDLTSNDSNDERNERLIPVLRHMITFHRSEILRLKRVDAVKRSTQKEIYRRLCIAKDVLQSSYMNNLDLNIISRASCMSVPQLVRQFKATFHVTPHQFLRQIRLKHAVSQLKATNESVYSVALANGFENASAFCRAFRKEFAQTPRMSREQ